MTSYKKITLTATVELTWIERAAKFWRESHEVDGQENPFLVYYDTLITGVPVVDKKQDDEGTLPEYCYPDDDGEARRDAPSDEYTEQDCEEDIRYEQAVVMREHGVADIDLDDCYPF